jgi:hypothetical protein
MKTLTVAAALLALLVLPAQAQMGGGKRNHDNNTKTEEKKPKIDEKAYNEALKRIPEPKEKYDPWSGARPPADPKPTK